MRILIISNIKENGYGESTRPYFIGKGLANLGHKVLHVCERNGREGSGISFMNTEWLTTPFSFLNRVVNFFSLYIQTNLFRPDIIYVHQLNNWTWSRLSRALPKSPRVYDSHTSSYFEHKMFGSTGLGLQTTFDREKKAVTEPELVITVSKETKTILSELYEVAKGRIVVVKNATQIKPVTKLAHPKNAKFICTSVLPIDGFPSNNMALDMLLDVAARTEKQDPNITFVVIGGGKKPTPKSNNVRYTGFVENFEEEILQSDICLGTYPETAVCGGVRNKICDFLALGQAIISTPEGMRGFDDCIASKNYIQASTASEFVDQIIRLKNNPDLVIKLKKESLTVGKKYQWENRALEVERLFKVLLRTK